MRRQHFGVIAMALAPGSNCNALNDPNAAYPCADAALIAPIKRSPEYRAVRPRLAGPAPVDSREDEGLHYFVFQMQPKVSAPEGAEPPAALFTLRRHEPAPACALVVALGPGGDAAVVTGLRQPGQTQRVSLG